MRKWHHGESVRTLNRCSSIITEIMQVTDQKYELSARTNEALKYRKDLKLENPDWLMFVSHPAQLLCKKPGETQYSIIKTF